MSVHRVVHVCVASGGGLVSIPLGGLLVFSLRGRSPPQWPPTLKDVRGFRGVKTLVLCVTERAIRTRSADEDGCW